MSAFSPKLQLFVGVVSKDNVSQHVQLCTLSMLAGSSLDSIHTQIAKNIHLAPDLTFNFGTHYSLFIMLLHVPSYTLLSVLPESQVSSIN